MKRLLTVVSLVALSVATAGAATPKHHVVKRPVHKPVAPHVVFLKYRVAPADEYFGRLKMSILGIRNTIRDMGLKADADPAHATAALGQVALTEDAMRDWEHKYPQDNWLPPAIFSLERLYAKVDTDDARKHARMVMAWLVHDYPHSGQAKIGRKELAENLVGARPSLTVAGNADGALPLR